jgi:hypothetical protein
MSCKHIAQLKPSSRTPTVAKSASRSEMTGYAYATGHSHATKHPVIPSRA